MSRWIRRSVLPLAAVVLGACESTSPKTRVPTRVVITPGFSTLAEKGSQQFVASVYDQNDKSLFAAVSWQSDHPELISIDANGLATAVASFTAIPASVTTVTITATAAGLSTTAPITLARTGFFDAFPDTNLVYPGMTRSVTTRWIRQMSALGHSPDLPIYDVIAASSVEWSSSDLNVVTVDAAGAMTPVAAGHARIVAKYLDYEDTVEVYVTPRPTTPLRFTSVTSDAPVLGQQGGGFAYAMRGCGLSTDGSVYCWGATLDSTRISDRCEQAGGGGVSGIKLFRYRCSEIPLRVQTDLKFTGLATTTGDALTFGASGCGLATTKRVYCWGANRNGELGIGMTDLATHAVAPISGTDEFNEVRSWGGSVCGIRTDGVLRCWGKVFGPSPVTVGAGITWRTLADASGCGLASDSTAYCFATGTAQSIGGATRWKAISAGPCALALDNTVYCGTNLQNKQTTTQPVVRLGTYAQGFAPDAGFGGVGPCGLTQAGDLECEYVSWGMVSTPVKLNSFFGLCAIGIDQQAYCRLNKSAPWTAVPGQ